MPDCAAKAVETRSLAPCHLQGLGQGMPAGLLTVDGDQDVGKETVVSASGQAFFAPFSWRWASIQLIGFHAVEDLPADTGNRTPSPGAELGGKIGDCLSGLDIPS